MHAWLTIFACFLFLTTACADPMSANTVVTRYRFDVATPQQWKLLRKLQEISGLAHRNNRLYAHDDQYGVVYEIDYHNGKLIKAFALGRRTAEDDFEGIAIASEQFFLVTSNGRLYEFAEGDNGDRVDYQVYETNLGERCEIEGLVYDPPSQQLLLVCKQPRRAGQDDIEIFAWSVPQKKLVNGPMLAIPRKAITNKIPGKEFNPSGIEIDPLTGHLLVVAARQKAFVELDRDGTVIVAALLPNGQLHRQPEGIAVFSDGLMVIADEGEKARARLSIYRPVH